MPNLSIPLPGTDYVLINCAANNIIIVTIIIYKKIKQIASAFPDVRNWLESYAAPAVQLAVGLASELAVGNSALAPAIKNHLKLE